MLKSFIIPKKMGRSTLNLNVDKRTTRKSPLQGCLEAMRIFKTSSGTNKAPKLLPNLTYELQLAGGALRYITKLFG